MTNINIVIINISVIKQKILTDLSKNYLGNINQNRTAKNIKYRLNFTINIIFFASLSCDPNLGIIFINSIYFIQNLFKIVLIFFHKPYKKYYFSYLLNILPIYSIMIPLYKEVGNIKIITDGISQILYPRSCLDIIVLLEETDKATLQEIYTLNITTPIKIIIIPYSIPRTKPKALNYGYFFTKGEFLTVYDAEDKPDSDQLLKSLQEFNKLPQEYSCLQARLNFYNYDENILTKLFSLEYYHWFNCLLSGLERLSLPIMLGGTSNHIKSRILKKVGLWDAYNVTEDADLSLRLYSNGYKIKLLDSYTLEECPIEILSWLFQRSRWIKGMIQTIIVYVKVSILYPNQIRVRDHFSIIIFVIISTYSFYVVPIIFFLECFFSDALYNNIWKYNIIIAMTYIYVSGILSLEGLYSKQNIYKKITLMNISALALFPIYFILHVIASYLALIQVILNPFKWNKTKHGITKHINHSGPNF